MTKHKTLEGQCSCPGSVWTCGRAIPFARFNGIFQRSIGRAVRLRIPLTTAVLDMITKRKFEFWGPVWGPAAIMLALPVVNHGLVYSCSRKGCVSLSSLPNLSDTWRQSDFVNGGAVAAIACWIALQVLLHILLPGIKVQGAELPRGGHLTYKLTGSALAFRVCLHSARLQC